MKKIIFILLLITYFLPFVWGQMMVFKIKKVVYKEEKDYSLMIRGFNQMTLIPIMNILLIRGLYKGLDVFQK